MSDYLGLGGNEWKGVWKVTINGYKVSFGIMKMFKNYILVMVAQLYKYIKPTELYTLDCELYGV